MFSHTDTVEISNITFVDCRRTTFVDIKKLRIRGSRFVSQYRSTMLNNFMLIVIGTVININDCSFDVKDNSRVTEAVLCISQLSNVTITQSKFHINQGSMLSADSMNNVQLTNVIFNNSETKTGLMHKTMFNSSLSLITVSSDTLHEY